MKNRIIFRHTNAKIIYSIVRIFHLSRDKLINITQCTAFVNTLILLNN